MHEKRHTILAINPGTRRLGIAVIKGGLLIDWGVLLIAAKSPQAKLQRTRTLVTRYLTEFTPSLLVLKRLNPSLSNEHLAQQHKEIQMVAKEHCITVRQFSIQEIEASLKPGVMINKRQLAELIVCRHPVLMHELRKEQDALNPYHIRMFEAVALGEMASDLVNGFSHS